MSQPKIAQLEIDPTQLKFGQDRPGLGVNIRMTDRTKGNIELQKSIDQEGILQSLLVWHDAEGTGEKYVLAGSRRLTCVLAIRSAAPDRFPTVPCLVRESGSAADALAWSIATDVYQVPPHQLDQYEAFAAFRATLANMSNETAHQHIAARFQTTALIVARRLALGGLDASIKAAWRANEIEPGTAIAFTLERDQKKQAKIFKTLKQARRLNAWAVRNSIIGDNDKIPAMLAIVGVDAYEATGGTVIKDLFAEGDAGADGVSDQAALIGLVGAVIDKKSADLLAQGWSWVSRADAMPPEWEYAWPRLELKRDGTSADRKKSGVVIEIGEKGLEFHKGICKPTPKAKAGAHEKTAAVDGAKEERGTPKTLMRELQAQITAGVANAIGYQPDLCLAALVAGFTNTQAGPVRVAETGLHKRLNAGEPARIVEFADALKAIVGKRNAVMAGMVAVVRRSLDFGHDGLDPHPLLSDDAAALCRLIKPAALNKCLRAAFVAADYFEAMPKPLCLAAIKEACGAEAHDRLSKKPKSAIMSFAVADVPKTGWLPPEMRAACYDGPGAVLAKKNEKKAPAKRGKGRK